MPPDCCSTDYDVLFDDGAARRELAAYHRSGATGSTARLLDAIRAAGAEYATVLDIRVHSDREVDARIRAAGFEPVLHHRGIAWQTVLYRRVRGTPDLASSAADGAHWPRPPAPRSTEEDPMTPASPTRPPVPARRPR